MIRSRMFKTDMDRLQTFDAVRTNPANLPPEIEQHYPEYRDILISMLSHNPQKRPSANDLLVNSVFFEPSKSELKTMVEEKEKKISALEARVCDFFVGLGID